MPSKGGYEDKAEEVMQYVRVRATSDGRKVRINNAEGLKEYMEKLNSEEKSKGNKPRFNNVFIRSITGTNIVHRKLPMTLGSFNSGGITEYGVSGNTVIVPATKEEGLKNIGVQIYRYDGGSARRATYKRGTTTVYTFRDVNTGRFVSKKRITE